MHRDDTASALNEIGTTIDTADNGASDNGQTAPRLRVDASTEPVGSGAYDIPPGSSPEPPADTPPASAEEPTAGAATDTLPLPRLLPMETAKNSLLPPTPGRLTTMQDRSSRPSPLKSSAPSSSLVCGPL